MWDSHDDLVCDVCGGHTGSPDNALCKKCAKDFAMSQGGGKTDHPCNFYGIRHDPDDPDCSESLCTEAAKCRALTKKHKNKQYGQAAMKPVITFVKPTEEFPFFQVHQFIPKSQPKPKAKKKRKKKQAPKPVRKVRKKVKGERLVEF